MRVAGVAIGLTWLVLAFVVALGALQLREQLRGQIMSRDGQILSAMARAQEGETNREIELLEEPWDVFMHIAGREGILGGWLFDTNWTAISWLPASVRDPAVPEEALSPLRAGQPFSLFHRALSVLDISYDTNILGTANLSQRFPVIEVYVPLKALHGEGPGGVAGFLIEGSSLAAQFGMLDRRLTLQALTLLSVAMGITGVALGMVFRRLNRAHRLLARRTEDLQRANQELSRSARIAALGAVTAHLVHGLRNPVSGLQTYVSSREAGAGDAGEEWREAKAATQRMQTLIHDVVRVIREQEMNLEYEVPLIELGEAVVQRARISSERRQIRVVMEGSSGRNVDNHTSGLLGLMLGNLMENAIEATPDGGNVRLHLLEQSGATICEVVDEGPGIPVAAQARLFQPQLSTKEGGSGLGLAITRQLALALGGDVRLFRSDAHGSTFRVELPPDREGLDSTEWLSTASSAAAGTGNPVRA